MRVEVVRIIADWLADATYGVNAMLAEVPRDNGDPQPADVTIADETRHDWVSRGVATKTVLDAGPYIAVAVYQPMTADGLDNATGFTYQPGEIPIAIRDIRADSDSSAANLASGITMRAVRWSLNLLRDHAHRSSRIRNLVQLHDFTIVELPATEQLGDVPVQAALLLRCNAIDALVTPA